MKTTQCAFLGKAISSILTLVLAGGLVPAGSMAFAVEAAEQAASSKPATATATGSSQKSETATGTSGTSGIPGASGAGASEGTGATEGAGADAAATEGSGSGTEGAGMLEEGASFGDSTLGGTSANYTSNTQGVLSADVPLKSGANAVTVGSMEIAGLTYTINTEDPTTVSVTGVATAKPQGDVSIEAQIANAGVTYKVTKISSGIITGTTDTTVSASTAANASAASASTTPTPNPYLTTRYAASAKAPAVTSITIPATVTTIDPAFFQLFPNAASINVAEGNSTYASNCGLLLDAAQTSLISVPEGMKGAAVLPATIATVPAYVFSRCTKLSAIAISDSGSARSESFASENGILYTADKTTLLAAPPALGATATLAAECRTIGEGAFYGNTTLQNIIAIGQFLRHKAARCCCLARHLIMLKAKVSKAALPKAKLPRKAPAKPPQPPPWKFTWQHLTLPPPKTPLLP